MSTSLHINHQCKYDFIAKNRHALIYTCRTFHKISIEKLKLPFLSCRTGGLRVISVDKIKDKCVVMEVQEKLCHVFVSSLPNCAETE